MTGVKPSQRAARNGPAGASRAPRVRNHFRDDDRLPRPEELIRLKDVGKVRALGASIHDRPRAGWLARMREFARIVHG
jgi:hypothetical protein